MARTQKWTLVGDDATYDGFVVYGRIENWNYFVKTKISFDALACPSGTVTQSKQVKSHTRERYPGDPAPITVASIPDGRKVYKNASKRSGGALPGSTVTFSTNPETWDGGDEERSFQLVGNISDLAMYLKGDAEKDIILTTSRGTNYLICAAEAGED
jgi:hypothetical protein